MKILVIRLSSIGDIVHALPAVALLRRSLPEAQISWAVDGGGGAALLKDSPAIDNLIRLDLKGLWKRVGNSAARQEFMSSVAVLRGKEPGGQQSIPEELAESAACRPDLVIDFQGLIKSATVALVSGSNTRVGFENSELRERPSKMFLTHQVETSRHTHIIEKNIGLARAAIERLKGPESTVAECDGGNGCAGPYEFPIALSEGDQSYADSVVGDKPFAILNPGGGWKTKLWPAERFGRVGDFLWANHQLPSIVTYGPGEESLARVVVDSSGSGKVRAIPSSLKQYVALAHRAAVFVGGDTGPLHLAAAAGTPIVGLYGPTSPERNGPFHPDDITVAMNLWCRADCHRRTCWHWECMDIPVSMVTDAVSARLRLARGDAFEGVN